MGVTTFIKVVGGRQNVRPVEDTVMLTLQTSCERFLHVGSQKYPEQRPVPIKSVLDESPPSQLISVALQPNCEAKRAAGDNALPDLWHGQRLRSLQPPVEHDKPANKPPSAPVPYSCRVSHYDMASKYQRLLNDPLSWAQEPKALLKS